MNVIRHIKRHPVYVEWHFEIGIIVLFIGLALVAVGLRQNTTEIDRQARAGAQAHVALCAQRDALRRAVAQNRRYLRLTPAERVDELGLPRSLAHVPDAVIIQMLTSQLRTLRSYGGLRC